MPKRRNPDLLADTDPAVARAKLKEEYEHCKHLEKDNGLSLEVESMHRIQTGAEAMVKAGFDPRVWKVKKCQATSWEVACKMQDSKTGSWSVETHPLWRVKIECERIVPKDDVEASDLLYGRLKKLKGKLPPRPKRKKSKKGRQTILEISLADVHAGKMAIDGTWSLEEFQEVVLRTIDEMIDRAAGTEIVEIVFPIGNDLLNSDTALLTTTKGTPQQQRVTYAEMYEAVKWTMIQAVHRLRQIANVKVIHVPGNHDWTSSRSVCSCLDAVFSGNQYVDVDLSETFGGGRKYYSRPGILLGFTHGNNEKWTSLPGIMMMEQPEAFVAAPICKEFHVGHRHYRKVSSKAKPNTAGDVLRLLEHESVVVRQLPSISPTDTFHGVQGYVGSLRANEGYLYDLEYGLHSTFTVSYQQLMG